MDICIRGLMVFDVYPWKTINMVTSDIKNVGCVKSFV